MGNDLISGKRYWVCPELVSAVYVKMNENKEYGDSIALFTEVVYNDYHKCGIKPVRFLDGAYDLSGYIPLELTDKLLECLKLK